MQAKAAIVICLLVFSINSYASDWTWEDTAWQSGVVSLLVVDWGQTRYISKNGDRFYERNGILGDHPELRSVDAYFGCFIVVHTVVAFLLPGRVRVFDMAINPRRIWQGSFIVSEGFSVGNNASMGIGFSF